MRHVFKCPTCNTMGTMDAAVFPDGAELEKLFVLLSRFGVKSYSNLEGVLSVEFHGAPQPKVEAQEATSAESIIKALAEEETCRCGHSIHAHTGEGFCMKGCQPAQCEAKSTADDNG